MERQPRKESINRIFRRNTREGANHIYAEDDLSWSPFITLDNELISSEINRYKPKRDITDTQYNGCSVDDLLT